MLIGDDDEIIAGHGRVETAKLLGLATVPTLPLSLDDARRRAYVLADNKLALNAGWDPTALTHEVQALVDVEFDFADTGFSPDEIELVIEATPGRPKPAGGKASASPADRIRQQPNSTGLAPKSDPSVFGRTAGWGPTPKHPAVGKTPTLPSPEDGGGKHAIATAGVADPASVPAPVAAPAPAQVTTPAPVTAPADLWLIGRHRVLCVDLADAGTLDRLLEGDSAVFAALDPAACDRLVAQARRLTGHDATLAETGQSFTEVAKRRRHAATRPETAR